MSQIDCVSILMLEFWSFDHVGDVSLASWIKD